VTAQGVTVCTTGGGPSGTSTAELALGPMLAAARRIPAGDAAVRDGRFQAGTEAGRILDGKTVGVIGLGRIGSRMAAYCKALGMTVLAWSQNLSAETAAAAGAVRVGKDELLSAPTSSACICSCRIARAASSALPDLARMRPGAILVNTARAQLVDEAALMAAVESGRLIAALDVFYREPLPADDPLARAPNVVLTPHLGYSAVEVYREYYQHAVENALAFLDGKPIRVLHAASR
jgi:Phosphoglycerate dehydrogenase and related dehydrogenases